MFALSPQAQDAAGCADGTREGFTDTLAFPKIAACKGIAPKFNVHNGGNASAFCASGWHVCSGAEVNRGRGAKGTGLTLAQAKGFPGIFVYDANNDCGECHDFCGPSSKCAGHKGCGGCAVSGGSDPDLACMGSGCITRSSKACMRDGRLDSGHGGCTVDIGGGTSQRKIDGIICCRDDYL